MNAASSSGKKERAAARFDKRAKRRTSSGRSLRAILIDLNHILLFIAIVSPLILLARIARRQDMRNRGWRFAAVIVLAASALAGFFLPSIAGFLGGTLWLLFLVIPSVAERKIDELFFTQRFTGARRLAVVRQILHPWPDSPHRPSLLRDLELARAGRLDLALDRLAQERGESTPAGSFATALTFALTENWPGLLQWFRRDFPVTTGTAVFSLYLRALGETGELDELVRQLASQIGTPDLSPRTDLTGRFNLAIVLAFCGRTDQFVRLTEADPRLMPRASRQFWRATAELEEGKRALALERLEKLRAERQDAILGRAVVRRLSLAGRAAPLSARSATLLDRLAAERLGQRGAATRPGRSGARAVWALLLVNAAFFGLELLLGGSTDSATLDYLGALEPATVVVRHEYWRLLSALFLHYGALHLVFNLFALYLLGPPLERLIGSAKFLAGYLLSGLGSSAGVVILWAFGLTNSMQLVGASGAIMGVVGVSAGLLLRHRQTTLAGRQLQNILMIVAIQTAFDLWTPQVSLAAHLGGFLSGVVVGTIFAALDRPHAAS
jgi:membrane associated rhomboid family serine protease